MAMLASFTGWHGWDALVAIGTLALATTTGVLAWFTYQVTRDNRSEIRLEQRRLEAAQRPVVLPAETEERKFLTLMNAGPGAALNISCVLKWPLGGAYTIPTFHLRPGGSKKVEIHTPSGGIWKHIDGRITCYGLAEDSWQTDFVITSPTPQTDPVLIVRTPRLIDYPLVMGWAEI